MHQIQQGYMVGTRLQRHGVSLGDLAAGVLILCLYIELWLVILHHLLAKGANPVTATIGRAFDITVEVSLPTFFAAGQAILAGVTALVVSAVLRKQGAKWWRVRLWQCVALFLLFVGIDDAATLHERVNTVIPLDFVDAIGFAGYPWHALFGPFLLAAALAAFVFLWFEFGRAGRIARPFLYAAAICVGIAVALDIVQGVDEMALLRADPLLAVASVQKSTITEEVLEMVAMTFVWFAILRFLNRTADGGSLGLIESDRIAPAG